jgi:hypothetical protein
LGKVISIKYVFYQSIKPILQGFKKHQIILGGMTMKVKHEINSISITSSELAFLWNTYLLNSKSKHVLMYAVAQCDDKDIRSVLQLALDLSAQSLDKVKKIFDDENQRVPYGFSDEDVYVTAPKIYSDKLMLYVLQVYISVGLSNYGTAIALAPRQDTRKFFTDSMISTIDLSNKIDDVSLEKGIYLRTPNIPTTQKVEFAEDKSIMGKIIGHKRPLTALEISGVFTSSLVNSIAEGYLLGLAQTIEDTRLKDFLNRAKKTLKEQTETLNDILNKENLTFPTNLESQVLNSSEPVFSDRLSMFTAYATLADVLTILSIGKLGSMRKDIFMTLSQLSGEILLLIKDSTDLMLERSWFEEMPKNVDREDITQ